MRTVAVCLSLFIGVGAGLMRTARIDAALTAQQRRELTGVRRDVRKVSALIRRKKFEEAEKILTTADEQVKKAAQGNEKDRLLLSLKRQIQRQRSFLERAQSGKKRRPKKEAGTRISFTQQIAPILRSRCGNCHVNRASGGLRFETFANFVKGGRNGQPVVAGNPQQSLLIRRLVASGNERMPKNGNPLPPGEIQLIANWIRTGARFDGTDRNAPIGQGEGNQPKAGNPEIPRPTGNETVSFRKEIAPFLANLCVRCHSGNMPRGGLRLVNFASMMKGGNSGRVILPGNLNGSILWQLVGTAQPASKKMPKGNAQITTTNHANLRTWILEGAKFDGDDPDTPLRRLVPTEAEIKTEKLAELNPEEFAKFRLQRSNEQWDNALRKEQAQNTDGKEVIVYGNVDLERLQEIHQWAEDHVERLRSAFHVKEKARLWKGRLTIFVIKDRFGYEEFNLVNNGRQQIQRAMTGHSVVVANMEDAYVALQDVGDEVTAENPGMRFNVIDHVTGAFLKRAGRELPDWLVRGTGIVMAAKTGRENAHIVQMRQSVRTTLESLEKPEDVFADGTFSPSAVGGVGYALVEFMMRRKGGFPRFSRFVGKLQSGNSVAAAMKSVYRADLKSVAGAFLGAVRK